MARFDTTGINDLINEVIRLGDAGQEVGDEMLMAAAKEVKQAWKESAQKHGLKDTGDMIESINYPNQPSDANGIRTIDIYPQGKDRKGVRNAEKAFILHYGSSKLKPTHWVDDADKDAGPKVQEAMEKVFDNFLNGKD
jgi:HK97 gp10 family phage protein